MGTMLNFLFIACLFWISPALADDYAIASKMEESGAKELALSFMQQHPEDRKWMALEIGLLSEFGKDGQVLDFADRLPFSEETAKLAAESAFMLKKPSAARDWLARLIWQGNLSKSGLRAARLRVIDSYFLEKDGKDGYYAMLRFNQDYHPVTKSEAHDFVSHLASNGMAKDAIPWLVLLDDSDPAKIRAELEAGLLSPADAVKAAGNQAEILLEAARMENDASLEIEALEMLLAEDRISAEDLWKSYLEHATYFSNRYALLQGNYVSWPDSIAKIPDPYAQRSLLAYLSAKNPGAVSLIVDSLKDEPKTASHLFSKYDSLPRDVRKTLGKMAFDSGDYENCAHYWKGIAIDLPDLALAQIRTGKPEDASASLLQYLKNLKALDPKEGDLILALAAQLSGKPGCSEVLTKLLPLLEDSSRGEALMLLGRNAQDPRNAAAYYFQASILPGARKEARIACMESLRKAGFDEDARAIAGGK